jgi:hypothetical protein
MKALVIAAAFFLPVIAHAEIPKGGIRLLTKSGGSAGANSDCHAPTITGNGKKMAVTTLATNLGAGVSNGFQQVLGFRRDGKLTGCLSKMAGGQLGNYDSGDSRLSKTGRYVAFENESALGLPFAPTGAQQVYWRDQKKNELRHVSVGPNGAIPTAHAFAKGISDDGRFVLFWTLSDNLVTNNNAMIFRAYVRDVELGITELVTVTNNGTPLDTSVFDVLLTGDGRYVVFGSNSTLLGYGANNQIYVRDRALGTTTLLSKNSNGFQGAASSQLIDVSNNGRFVIFTTAALNLVQPLFEGNVVLLDRETGELRAVDVSIPGQSITFAGYKGAISNDGRRLILGSDFVDSVTKAKRYSIYEYNLATQKHWLVAEVQGQTHQNCHLHFDASATCEWVIFSSQVDLVEQNGVIDAYLYRAH